MDTYTYERPREKLQQKGVSALTNAELLQVIIGSGSAGLPVTKIARKVNKTLRLKGLNATVEDLLAIQGLGKVKAGQILASFELVMRVAQQENNGEGDKIDVLNDLYADVKADNDQTLVYALFDGANRFINDYSQVVAPADDTAKIVRKLFGEVLAQSAVSVVIILGSSHQVLEPSMFELSLARDVYSTSKLLSIPVVSFKLVSPIGEHVFKELAHGK